MTELTPTYSARTTEAVVVLGLIVLAVMWIALWGMGQ